MAVLACSWLMATTAENPSRTERQYSLNGDYAIPYYGSLIDLPSFSYLPEIRANNYLNRPFTTSAPGMIILQLPNFLYQIVSIQSILRTASSGERTFQTLINLITGRPLLCPACPTCPTCPVCPVVPVIPAQAITLTPAVGECLTTAVLNTASVAPCSRVSAAPKGTIDVTFSDTGKLQTVTIGIVAVAPNTQIQLTCKAIPTGGDSVAKTQVGAITSNVPITSNGFLQIIASGAGAPDTAIKLTCSWVSS
ncbi:hypothetical protein DAPPUDRAFT_110143 [Daphnia pulex]|uniref:Uncharacterized protein n=1 Tax=Daphnia pulex TaxID=6669 RepID=E9H5M1_DAPPU|nr:hypothetical protein DAPPUDRAFT_110143 [Daphnia pulex]|eukprot:EFX72887.1 hypothetical protein DAPPUDRAFT_110143 [Daphnia pulex]